MGQTGKLKKPQFSQGSKIKVEDLTQIKNFHHPIFCFRYLQKGFHLSDCEQDEKNAFLDRLLMLSSMTWNEIQLAPKHGLGSEKIAISSLKAPLPTFITDDVNFLLAFRFHGKRPFVGHRDKFVLHIIYIDRAFTLYPH